MEKDKVGHSSIQAWSAGALFPAVIARIERYCDHPAGAPCAAGVCQRAQCCACPAVSFELTIGAFVEEYATREDAGAVARSVCQRGRINAARYAELRARTLAT